MNIVDSTGWIEYIADAANADFFEPVIVDSENLFVPTICSYEVFKRVLQEFGRNVHWVRWESYRWVRSLNLIGK